MPENDEMDKLGQAIIFLGYSSYNTNQQKFINDFLQKGAMVWDKERINVVFNHNSEIIKALMQLHQFTTKHQKNTELIDDFKSELSELMITINGRDEIISI